MPAKFYAGLRALPLQVLTLGYFVPNTSAIDFAFNQQRFTGQPLVSSFFGIPGTNATCAPPIFQSEPRQLTPMQARLHCSWWWYRRSCHRHQVGRSQPQRGSDRSRRLLRARQLEFEHRAWLLNVLHWLSAHQLSTLGGLGYSHNRPAGQYRAPQMQIGS